MSTEVSELLRRAEALNRRWDDLAERMQRDGDANHAASDQARRVARLEAIQARYDKAVTDADRVDPKRGRLYSPEYAKSLKDEASRERDASIAELRAEVDKLGDVAQAARDAWEERSGDDSAPLAWATEAERSRAENLRPEVRRQVENSTIAELRANVRQAVRQQDWVTCRVWLEEIGQHAPSHVAREIAGDLGELTTAAKNPAREREIAGLEERFERAQRAYRVAAEILEPLDKEALAAKLRANGAYAPL